MIKKITDEIKKEIREKTGTPTTKILDLTCQGQGGSGEHSTWEYYIIENGNTIRMTHISKYPEATY